MSAEIRADEHAARIRDYGEADAATYEQRVRDGADTVQNLEPEPTAASPENQRSRYAIGNARLDNLELTDEENERYLDEIAESYGLSREQVDDYYERVAGGYEPKSDQPAPDHSIYDDFLNEATERAMSRRQGGERER